MDRTVCMMVLVVGAAVVVAAAGCKDKATRGGAGAAASAADAAVGPTTPVAAGPDASVAAAGPDAGVAAARACVAGAPAVADAAGLGFLAGVGGRLEIELTEAPQQIAPNLANQKAPPTARIKRLELDTYVFGDDMRPLTPAELDQVVFRGAALQLRGLGKPVTHTAADCTFTVRDVLDAVEETERRTRDDSEWFDGVDVHHRFFEGIYGGEADGVWRIGWGS